MKKSIWIPLFFLLNVLLCSAQQTVVDSLLNVVKASKMDTVKVNVIVLHMQEEFSVPYCLLKNILRKH